MNNSLHGGESDALNHYLSLNNNPMTESVASHGNPTCVTSMAAKTLTDTSDQEQM